MQQACSFVEDNLTGLQEYCMSTIVVVFNDQRPIFMRVLVDIDNGADHMRVQAVAVWLEYRAVMVIANAINVCWHQGPMTPLTQLRSQLAMYCGLEWFGQLDKAAGQLSFARIDKLSFDVLRARSATVLQIKGLEFGKQGWGKARSFEPGPG